RLLAALCAVMQAGQIISERLQRINQVIQVLDLCYGPESPECGPDSLSYDRGLANTRIGYPQFSMLLLQSCETLIYIADLADILADRKDRWVTFEGQVETCPQHLPAVNKRGCVRIYRIDTRYFQRRLFRLAIQVRTIPVVILQIGILKPFYQFVAHRRRL